MICGYKPCGKEFIPGPRQKGIKHCSRKCTRAAENLRRHGEGRSNGLFTGTQGAVGELVAASNLLERGFEVYRSMSPFSSCDLIAMKNGKLIRVEVKYRTSPIAAGYDVGRHQRSKFDLLVVITPSGVSYRPEITSFE